MPKQGPFYGPPVDDILVTEVASASFDVFVARLLMQRRGDDVAVEVFGVKLASSFARMW